MRTQLAVAGLAAAAVAGGALFVARHGSAGPSPVAIERHPSLVEAAEKGDAAGALAALKAGERKNKGKGEDLKESKQNKKRKTNKTKKGRKKTNVKK